MKPDVYLEAKQGVIDAGFSQEIVTIKKLLSKEPTEEQFLAEYVLVVCNSGMKAEVASEIMGRVWEAIWNCESALTVFGHTGKANAIDFVSANYVQLFQEYEAAEDKLAFLQTLPWIGKITKYHLGRNLGLNVVKPDLHLIRIANRFHTTPEKLCRRLEKQTGDKAGLIDCVLWRASKLGLV